MNSLQTDHEARELKLGLWLYLCRYAEQSAITSSVIPALALSSLSPTFLSINVKYAKWFVSEKSHSAPLLLYKHARCFLMCCSRKKERRGRFIFVFQEGGTQQIFPDAPTTQHLR